MPIGPAAQELSNLFSRLSSSSLNLLQPNCLKKEKTHIQTQQLTYFSKLLPTNVLSRADTQCFYQTLTEIDYKNHQTAKSDLLSLSHKINRLRTVTCNLPKNSV